jgi:preprotein translocase subunit SecA
LAENLGNVVKRLYEDKERRAGPDFMRYQERMIMLQVLDMQWKDHLLALDHLKEGIGLRGYGQRDPLIEYKKESFDMFQAMLDRIEEETVRYLFLIQPVAERPQEVEMPQRRQRPLQYQQRQQTPQSSAGGKHREVRSTIPKKRKR